MNKQKYILGLRIDMVQISDVCKIIESWITDRTYGNYIVVANANDAVISKHDQKVREAINNSSLTVPDGISLVLASRLRGSYLKKRVYGPDLMLEFFRTAENRGYSNFFYGASDNTLKALVKNLKGRFPDLKIAGTYSPPYRELTESEDKEISEYINGCSPDILWVGLGCPKQQLWMYKHKNSLRLPVMVGVGAAFDFLSGIKPQAPRWIRNNGFEWLFRLASEPKRLWRRYFINGSLFVYYILKELFSVFLKNNHKNTSKSQN